MAHGTSVKTWKKNGYEVEITLTGKGHFEGTFDDGEEFIDPTLDGLEKKLDRAVKSRSKSRRIEATLLERESWSHKGPDLTNVLITGWHTRNRCALYRTDDAKSTAGQAGYSTKVLRRLTPAEATQLKTSYAAWKQAEEAYNKLVRDAEYHAGDVQRLLAGGTTEGEDE
jgi:hypothetical protein